MCKIGIISDIHGDVESLEKAIRLFDQHGVQTILCAGDTVEKGNHEDRVVELLKAARIPCVQGNHDENAIRHYHLSLALKPPAEIPLADETIEFLCQLPNVIEAEIAKIKVLVCHATPSDNGGRVFHAEGGNRLSKRFKKDLARTNCEVIVVGHTHSPIDVQYRGKRILNPGAVCKLKEKDSHTAGVLDLPSIKFSVFRLEDGKAIDLPSVEAV